MRFENRTVVVTGASSGIGARAAAAFAREGARVAITGRDPDRTRQTAAGLGAVHHGLGDITDPAYCGEFLEQVAERTGGIDVLVNNAGTILRRDTAETTAAQWREIMAVNVDAVFFMSREALKRMRPRGAGAIVNVSSTCGLVGAKGLVAYCTTKGAVIQMTQAMALDCAAQGIRVNAVCPGATDTPMLFSKHDRTPTRGEMEQTQKASVPIGRMAAPDEVVSAILYLASAEASYITGTHLAVDGGYTAR